MKTTSPSLRVYSSSAGSGKTYTLTKSFLEIILKEEDPLYFKHVLAITFTNAAASEMKHRIQKTLSDFSLGQKSPMFDDLCQALNFEPITLQQKSKKILEALIYNYSLLAVSTLDSFASSIINAFKLDLNLPFNFETVLNSESHFFEAIDNLFTKIGSDIYLENTIKEYAYSQYEDAKKWKQLRQNLKVFYVLAMKSDLCFLKKNFSKDELKEFGDEVNIGLKTRLDHIKKTANNLKQKIIDLGLQIEDFPSGKAGYIYLIYKLEKILTYNFSKLFGKRVLSIIQEPIGLFEKSEWYTKTSKNKTEILELAPDIQSFYKDLHDFYIKEIFMFAAIKKDMAAYKLLELLQESSDEVLNNENQRLLSSFNERINKIVKEEPMPFIYERVGQKYFHIMLDEFQDTSDTEFTNLIPLLENSLSLGKNSLIVGDEKQSIYSFKGGKMGLLPAIANNNLEVLDKILKPEPYQIEQLNNILPYIDSQKLDSNYRSASEIITFNNEFFEFLSKIDTIPDLDFIYSNFKQEIPSTAKKGAHVSVSFFTKNEVENKLLSQIHELLENGYNYGDIGVLVSKNDHGVIIAEILKDNQIPVSTPDALKLLKQVPVNFLLTWIKLFQEPQNTFYRFALVQFMVQMEPNLDFDTAEIEEKSISEFLELFKKAGFILEEENLKSRDFYFVLEYLMEVFNLWQVSGLSPFLYFLLDLAQSIINENGNRPDLLLQFFEDFPKTSVSDQGENAVKVSTIHKAKGLEYPVVILPYFNFSNGRKDDRVLVDIDKNNLRKYFKNTDITSLFLPTTSDFDYIIENQEMDNLSFLERINKIYVALTRPTEKLYIWLQAGKSKDVFQYFTSFLENKGLLNPGEVDSKTEYKKVILFEGEKGKLDNSKVEKPAEILNFEMPTLNLDTKLKLRFTEYSDINNPNINSGDALHAAFEKLKVISDLPLIQKNLGSNIDYYNNLEQLLASSEISPCFMESNTHFIEQEILTPNGAIYRPDKMTLTLDNVLYVLDYKTGDKLNSHKKQVLNYGRLMQEIGYENVKMYLLYLNDLEIQEVLF